MLLPNVRRDAPPLIAAAGGATLLALAIGAQPAIALTVAAALLAASLVVVFVLRPHWVAPVVLAGFVLQPFLKTFVSPDFGPAKDVIVFAALAAALASRALLPARPRPGTEADAWLIGGVLLLLGLYLVNPGGTHDAAWAHGSRLVVEAFGLFLLGYTTARPERAWRYACFSLIAVGLANAAYGLYQQSLGSTRLILDYGYTWGVQVRETATGQFRSFGTLDDPFNYAAVLLLALAVAIFSVRRLVFTVPICALLLVGLAGSYVRTAIFAVAVMAAVLLLRGRRGMSAVAIAAAIVVASAAYLLVTPQGAGKSATGLSFITTLNDRTPTWAKVINGPFDLIGGRGVGAIGSGAARAQFGTVAPSDLRRDPASSSDAAAPVLVNIDSSYFATVADVGLIGLAVLIAVGLRAMSLAVAAARRGSGSAWAAIAIGCVLTIDATTRSSLTAFPFGFVGLYALGLALAQARVERAAHQRPVLPHGAPENATVAHEHR